MVDYSSRNYEANSIGCELREALNPQLRASIPAVSQTRLKLILNLRILVEFRGVLRWFRII